MPFKTPYFLLKTSLKLKTQRKSRGPKTNPWGTPHLISLKDEVPSLTEQNFNLLLKYEEKRLRADVDRPRAESLARRME